MIKETRRKDMKHFHDMKDMDFINFCLDSNGEISNLKTFMKVDGISARFGKDENGLIYFEGARTGPIFNKNSFSKFARDKGYDVDRAKHYDDILNIFQDTDLLDGMPNDSKIVCELLYIPLSSVNGDEVTCIHTPYDLNKLGTTLTILPYFYCIGSTGEVLDYDLSFLFNKSNEMIKVISPRLKMYEIDISVYCDRIKSFKNKDTITSRKKCDKVLKDIVKDEIMEIKKDLGEYILASNQIHGKYGLGKNIEGIVIWVNNKEYKITTETFKKLKAKL